MDLFSVSAGNAAVVVGGRVFSDVGNLKYLSAWVTSAGNSGTAYENGVTPYQVPVGKKFQVMAVRLAAVTNSATRAVLGYGDTNVGINSAATPTTPIYFMGAAALYVVASGAPNAAGQQGTGISELSLLFEVPAGKYLFTTIDNGGMFYIYGYEVGA